MRTTVATTSDSHAPITLDTKAKTRLRAGTMKSIIAILCLAALSAYAQQDIDLTGYKLVFSDEFNTLSVGSANGKGDANGATGRLMVPQERSAVHTGQDGDYGSISGILFSDAVWNCSAEGRVGQ